MTVSVPDAEVPFKKNVNTRADSVRLVGEAVHARELEQVRVAMLDGLRGVMEGPANDASQYQIATGGSLLRARLALASCKSFARSQEYAVVAAASCELIHNASLVHDDLLDGDELRRGQPTVWRRHGKGVALCAGDLLLCSAFAVASGLEDAPQSRFLTQHLAAMTCHVIVGQSVEIAPRDAAELPLFRAYMNAARAKTVPLIQLPLMTGAIAAKVDGLVIDTINGVAEAIGLAYQIIDDLDDLSGPEGDMKSQVAALHPFHAWHHHRGGQKDSPELRVHRATRHALALLQRGRHELNRLEKQVCSPMTPTLGPLMMQLEHRAQAHRHCFRLNGGMSL